MLLADVSDRGGIAAYTERLFGELTDQGVDVALTAPRGLERGAPPLARHVWGPAFEAHGAVWRKGRLVVEMFASTLALIRAVARVRPDVLHLQTEVIPGAERAILAYLRRRVAIVITAHDPIPHEGGVGVMAKAARRWRMADAVVVHGHEPKRIVETSAGGAAVAVIPADLCFGGEPVARRDARAKLGLPSGPVALLFGLLRPYKGLDLLKAAWPDVVAAIPHARLYVVGQAYAPARESLDELAGLDGVMLREGFVPEEEIDLWAAAADVMVVPYSHGTHSQVLHRAVEMGTPVIASPPLAEEVHRLAAGVAVPLEARAWSDALVRALATDPLPAPPRPPGGSTAKKTLELYRQLLQARAGRRNRMP